MSLAFKRLCILPSLRSVYRFRFRIFLAAHVRKKGSLLNGESLFLPKMYPGRNVLLAQFPHNNSILRNAMGLLLPRNDMTVDIKGIFKAFKANQQPI